MTAHEPWPVLPGRQEECGALAGLVDALPAGGGRVLLLLGEPGIGKTALLDVLARRVAGTPGMRVARATAVPSEAGLPFAGLHQLCAPHLDRLGTLTAPHREVLETAFRLRPGPAPDPRLAGPALLALLATLAGEHPLVCAVDDAQWLDPPSAAALGSAARGLGAVPVALAVAARGPAPAALRGLPELAVRGLAPAAARALLDTAVPLTLDRRVRATVLAESRGNPLALLTAARRSAPVHLAYGGAGAVPDPVADPDRCDPGLTASRLPAAPRLLLLLAAADPTGDAALLRRAARALGLRRGAADAAEASGLLRLRPHVRFRHPLGRAAVYAAAPPHERRRVHRALAAATSVEADPDRRAWHRALAADGADEAVAADLDRWAGRALTRGGLAAAAAFLEQSAALTPDPLRRAHRSLRAVEAADRAGTSDGGAALRTAVRTGPLPAAERAVAAARLEVVEARAAVRLDPAALPRLLAAARDLAAFDVRSARDAQLDAMAAAVAAGRLAPAAGPAEVALTVLAGPRAEPGHRGDTLLDAAALMVTGGAGAAAQALRVVRALAREPAPGDEVLRRGWLAGAAAVAVWDDDSWDALTRRHLDAARGLHALDVLSPAVQQRALVEVLTGDLAAAAALLRAPFPQAAPVPDAGGAAGVPHGLLGLLAVRGRVEEADPVLVRCLDLAVVRGDGLGFATAHWARAVLSNALGDYETAVAAAREATASRLEPGPPGWALAELAEAAVRTGDEDTARAATQELTGTARASGTEWALGVAASRQALLQGGDGAERLHGEAVERLAGTRMCLDLARARLLRGEWLRREGRRVDARAELRSAADAFAAMGAAAFADRARRELLATGETVRRRTADTTRRLTAQEGHIARLVARGSTNPEIAAALFISPRTVEWHVRRIFTKLGVGSRREVRRALGDADPDHDPGPWSGPGWGPGPSTGPTGPGTQEAS